MIESLFEIFKSTENLLLAISFCLGYLYLLDLRKNYKFKIKKITQIDIFFCSAIFFFLFLYMSLFLIFPLITYFPKIIPNLFELLILIEVVIILILIIINNKKDKKHLTKTARRKGKDSFGIHIFVSVLGGGIYTFIILIIKFFGLLAFRETFFYPFLPYELEIFIVCFGMIFVSLIFFEFIILFSNYLFET